LNDTLPADRLAELMQLAIAATHSVSELILSGFRSPTLKWERKSDGSVVTPFDLESERRIRAFIEAEQPYAWPVLGEELGGEARGSRYHWIVDPIDGTLPFSRGLPTFGTLLALEDSVARHALVGVVNLPALGETYSAARGAGAWCDGKRIGVAPARALKDCIVSAPVERFPQMSARAAGELPHLRCFADCYAHAMVARGTLDALAEFRLARWDIAASQVLIEEAGGTVRIAAAATAGKWDLILGSPDAAAELARLVDFPAPP
jgi:fructose-1,6-bisphosphatase/inositol monophosphatase family enzyme